MVYYRLSDPGSTVADLLSKANIREAKEIIGPKARMIVPSEAVRQVEVHKTGAG